MGHRVSKTFRSSKRETHKWRHREIYTTDRKKYAPGQRDTHGRAKHANKQQDIIGQSLIHSEPFRHTKKVVTCNSTRMKHALNQTEKFTHLHIQRNKTQRDRCNIHAHEDRHTHKWGGRHRYPQPVDKENKTLVLNIIIVPKFACFPGSCFRQKAKNSLFPRPQMVPSPLDYCALFLLHFYISVYFIMFQGANFFHSLMFMPLGYFLTIFTSSLHYTP